jgi:hypothetical protein
MNEITSWQLYWITRCDALVGVAAPVAFTLGMMLFFAEVITIIMSAAQADECNSKGVNAVLPQVRRLRGWLTGLFVFFFAVYAFVPTTREAATIILLPKALNSEFVNQTLPQETQELYGLLKAWLKDQVAERKSADAVVELQRGPHGE